MYIYVDILYEQALNAYVTWYSLNITAVVPMYISTYIQHLCIHAMWQLAYQPPDILAKIGGYPLLLGKPSPTSHT